MKNMQTSSDGRTQLEFLVPSRGLIGFRGEFVRITRGEGIMSHFSMNISQKVEILKLEGTVYLLLLRRELLHFML